MDHNVQRIKYAFYL